jgi:hypothetical protein
LASFTDSRGFDATGLAKKSVEGWLNSPGHRRNLLDGSVSAIGVGIAKAPGAAPKYLAVQVFAHPRSAAITFQISNATRKPVTYTYGGDRESLTPGQAMTHTSCQPADIVFETAGTGSAARKLGTQYKAAPGMVYVVNEDAAGAVRVSAEPRQTVE